MSPSQADDPAPPTASIFNAAMSGKWNDVLDLFRKSKKVRCETITRNNDTVLHVTISSATQNFVLQLLNIVKSTNTRDEKRAILGAKNKRGETPLHLAAALGQEHVCYLIAEMMPKMVTEARNNDQETPLFTAVRHGRKHAFFVLEYAIWKSNNWNEQEIYRPASGRDTTHCRRCDGNNILHYAIKGEHFDLAYEIIDLYPELVNCANESREYALHVLAKMPSVFKSGTRFSFYDRIIYNCVNTEPLELKFHNFREIKENLPTNIHGDGEVMPKTYKVCVDLFLLIMKWALKWFSLIKERVMMFNSVDFGSRLRACLCKRSSDGDLEQPGSQKGVYGHETPKIQEQRRIPQNYDVAVFFLNFIVKLLLVVLGIGLRRLPSIQKLKQKHRNAETIMKEMVDQSKLWDYKHTGSGGVKPESSTLMEFLYDTESRPDLTATEATIPGPEDNQQNPSKPGPEDNQQNPSKPAERTPSTTSNNPVAVPLATAEVPEGQEITPTSTVDPPAAAPSAAVEVPGRQGASVASPFLVAATRGITEMVTTILEKFPMAILDQDKNKKNIVLLAAQHRQVHVYNLMLEKTNMNEMLFRQVDKNGNSALHLAARLTTQSRSWSMHGSALHMQFESNWFKYVLGSVDQGTFAIINNKGKTAQDVFLKSHQRLMKEGSSWLTNTAESCTVVATLIATVAFASASQVPGGVNQDRGSPVLADRPAFQMFAISSLVALCFSVTSLVLFLAILTSRYQASQFERGLPMKLILGLTTLFISIASMLVSFCAGDFFVVGVKFVAYPIYVVMCFPVIFFIISTYPIYAVMFFPLDF